MELKTNELIWSYLIKLAWTFKYFLNYMILFLWKKKKKIHNYDLIIPLCTCAEVWCILFVQSEALLLIVFVCVLYAVFFFLATYNRNGGKKRLNARQRCVIGSNIHRELLISNKQILLIIIYQLNCDQSIHAFRNSNKL